MRFSLYIVWPVWVKIISNYTKQKQWGIFVYNKNFDFSYLLTWLAITSLQTTIYNKLTLHEPAIKPVNSTWLAVFFTKNVASMSSKLEPATCWRNTGQQISCFDRCHSTIAWESNIKKCALNQGRFSLNLIAGIWPPTCANPPSSSSSSCVRAHKQYR